MEIQKAVCLWYGFGIAMNKPEASDILNRVGKIPADINTTLPWKIARPNSLGTLIKTLTNAQEISSGDHFDGFSFEDIEKATYSLLQDLCAIEENFDRFNSLWLAIAKDLVHLNFQLERWNQVQELLPKCIEVSEAIFGQGHAETMNLLHVGARMYRKLRQWAKAEEMELQSCKGSINIRSRIASVLSLASIYRGQGRLQDAEEIELKVVEWETAILGEDNNSTRMAMRNLILTYLAQKKFQEAKKLALKVLEMDERIMGRDHLDTLITESHLGSIYFYEKRYPEAENKWLDVLDRKYATLGPHHPSTCTTMENLAWVYKEQGMLDEAKEYAQKSVLAHFSQDPPGALDAITICIQVWQQSLGAGAQYIVPQGDNATPEMYRAYLLARPEFDARVEEAERLQELDREMMMRLIWYNHSTVV
jgi:tetratricopeptide (TPR) repeat protein